MNLFRLNPMRTRTSSLQSDTRRSRKFVEAVLGLLLLLVSMFVATEVRAQAALPVNLPTEELEVPNVDLIYSIDLDTLPARPTIIVDVTPQSSHPDIEFEIEIRNVTPYPGNFSSSIGCPISAEAPPNVDSWLSEPAFGAQHLEADLFFCHPDVDTWTGRDAEVRVRVLDFASGEAPAIFSVEIRAVTTIPTQFLPVQVMGPQSVTVAGNANTVLYADQVSFSNGAGSFLWSGTYVTTNPFGTFRFPRTSLLKFTSLDSRIPPNALITNVDLDLVSVGIMGIGGPVDLFAVAPGPFWSTGSANASGSEFFGATTSSSSSASWTRRSFSNNWLTPGGDTTTVGALSTLAISGPGPQTFNSPALDAAVQTMVDNNQFFDGFKLSGPFSLSSSAGVQFASRNHFLEEIRPSITVDFTQSEPYSEGRVDSDLVDYIDEGENFRWIYDDDLDGIFTTLIGGVCEEDSANGSFTTPYTYSYTGTPGYIGHDCCSWRIESAQAQIVGTGQALFFHNLDVTDPANMPPDADADGMLDPCDNCPNTPNGPFLGTCMVGTTIAGGTCQSDLECGSGETCDLSQLDDDGDTFGNACPEPGFGIGLMLGSMLLVSGQRSRHGRDMH